MISSIDIARLGVIDRAVLEFGKGLTVLTGETGAGKTMILTSLALLLGGRADPALVRSGGDRADIDGIFLVTPQEATRAEEAGGIVENGELIVSRTIRAEGRSRARLGGRPVPAQTLAEVCSPLVTIHGQAEQMRLKSPSSHRKLLDAAGGPTHAALVEEYRQAWGQAVALKHRLDDILTHSGQLGVEAASLSEALEAIDALDPREGEDEELRIEARRLMNISELADLAQAASLMIAGGDDEDGAQSLISGALDHLRSAQRFDESLNEIASRLESSLIDIETLNEDLHAYIRGLDEDPQRLREVQDRRALLKRLLEGRAADAAGLREWAESARERLCEIHSLNTDPELVRAELEKAQEKVLSIGERVRTQRQKIAHTLSEAVDRELHALAMKDAHLLIEITPAKPSSHGLDEVTILLQAHPLASPRPLGQGASGGELSRIMLALEVVLGEHDSAGTFIFDEVDAGIGGLTASEVGARLARLARTRQVIVVTHLPQVAVFADTHLVVTKTDGRTEVTRVDGKAREGELTRMMGGDPHSPAARRHAIEVLSSSVPQSQR